MTMRSRTLIALCAGAVFGFSGAIAGDVMAERRTEETVSAPAALPWEQARLFAEVYERIKREYVDDVDDKRSWRRRFAAWSPRSTRTPRYLDSEEFEEIRLSTMGSYPGVGIEVVAEDSAVKVLRPIEGSPADQAGIQSGDLDRADRWQRRSARTSPAPSPACAAPPEARCSSPSAAPATGELLDFSLRRAKVEVHSVSQTSLEPGYGYVRITSFSETTRG